MRCLWHSCVKMRVCSSPHLLTRICARSCRHTISFMQVYVNTHAQTLVQASYAHACPCLKHTNTRAHTRTQTHAHALPHAHAHAYAHTHATTMHVQTQAHTHRHAHTHARTHARTRARTHARTDTRAHARTHVHTHTHTHSRADAWKHARKDARTDAHKMHIHTCMRTRAYACMIARKCTRAHTYTWCMRTHTHLHCKPTHLHSPTRITARSCTDTCTTVRTQPHTYLHMRPHEEYPCPQIYCDLAVWCKSPCSARLPMHVEGFPNIRSKPV